MNVWLIAAILASALIVLAAPFMGQLRAAIRSAFPEQFVLIVGTCIGVAVASALVAAIITIRERRAARFGAIAFALAIASLYSIMAGTGLAAVDVVERVHFIEYGIITILFYLAWRPNGDLSTLILPVLAGVLVGTLDEWLQWFLPVRVGEARDVLLNLFAICCGLLFGVALSPPRTFKRTLRPASTATVCLLTGATLLIFAAFVNAVHLGYQVDLEGVGTFKSHFTREQLEANARDRAAKWSLAPPMTLRRLSREDQYMDEGLWHVRRRNEVWDEGNIAEAWSENLILERFFAPVLDTPSYAAPAPSRWPPAQREDAKSHAQMSGVFVSSAEAYPILIGWKRVLWSATLLAVFAALVGAWRATS